MSFKGKAWQHNAIQSKPGGHLELIDDVSHDVEVISAAVNPGGYKLVETPTMGRIVVPSQLRPG